MSDRRHPVVIGSLAPAVLEGNGQTKAVTKSMSAAGRPGGASIPPFAPGSHPIWDVARTLASVGKDAVLESNWFPGR
jgi:hypothetical protein